MNKKVTSSFFKVVEVTEVLENSFLLFTNICLYKRKNNFVEIDIQLPAIVLYTKMHHKDANEIHTYIMTCSTNEYSLENRLLYNTKY